ncbi:DUF3617 domain-containing protein [Noviherbaspirillum denitrificans]|uniref:DUF3617 domain-containing protein n=1 Tax=Noviherbaspirillum denitrificans TaxID=1968433 RepID=A0A254TDK5_9BURK|nr:DUF3617 domain-containing protein [Noviherbaspirillum denitrificans]OWW20247.1 hypothetical protein AYR66_12835 [Noviherbaspirillum denitrificans]
MRKNAIPLLLLSMLSASAFAAGQMKPGLWEMTMKSDAMKNMPKMTPEQMEQMRKMGMNVPQIQDGAMVHKICVTKQMTESNTLPGADGKEMGCQTKNMQQSGNSYSADVVCNSAQMKGEGKVKGSFSGDTAFTSTYDFKGTMHGQQVNQHHENSGKWLSADCGNVPPAGGMMPKK